MVAHLLAIAVLAAASPVWAEDPATSRLSVIVQAPDKALDEHWQALHDMNAAAEMLLIPKRNDGASPYDFTDFEDTLKLFATKKMNVFVSVAPHLPGMPWQPEIDETGRSYTDRQNPFDPAFLDEWERLHREFCARYKSDPRVRRVYVNPPSFFGESEYYMGPDWFNRRYLCYGPLARARFAEWLQKRYGTADKAAAAWHVAPAPWDRLPLATPRTGDPSTHLDNAWLDLMEFRVDYMADIISNEVNVLLDGFDGQAGFKFSGCDYAATRGSDSAEIAARCKGGPKFVLHSTNGHSLPELKYAGTLVRRYKAATWVCENDGERFNRTESAKVLLNAMLAGVSSFNFAHFGHLLTSFDPRRTDMQAALNDVRRVLERYDLDPPRKPLAFLHSNSSMWVRAPGYYNADVIHVYDSVLNFPEFPESQGFDWAHQLDMPDVTGERPVADGDLDGRRILVIPNTSLTTLKAAAFDAIQAWMEKGGTLVAFGPDAYGWRIDSAFPADGSPRCRRVLDLSVLPPVESVTAPLAWTDDAAPASTPLPSHVWKGPLPAEWEPLVATGDGKVAVARKRIGQGALILFPSPVPAKLATPEEPYYRDVVPKVLRRLAARAGCPFSHEAEALDGDKPGGLPPLTVGYAGRDRKSGRHVFVGGACGAADIRFRFTPEPSITGPAEILFVDVEGVKAEARGDGAAPVIERSRPSQRDVYRDPTHEYNVIPCISVRFAAPQALVLEVNP